MSSSSSSVYLAQYLARCGSASRRRAIQHIQAGLVKVNGAVIHENVKISPHSRVELSGVPLVLQCWRVFVYHKPRSELVSHSDPDRRTTIFQSISQRYPNLPRLISVGRLDLDSEGLIVLTNAPPVARYLELPANAFHRRYRVRAFGDVPFNQLRDSLAKGVNIDGEQFRPMKLDFDSPDFQELHQLTNQNARKKSEKSMNRWVIATLTEGKSREIRRVFDYLGLQVNRIVRFAYGPFSLWSQPIGSNTKAKAPMLRMGECREVELPDQLRREIEHDIQTIADKEADRQSEE